MTDAAVVDEQAVVPPILTTSVDVPALGRMIGEAEVDGLTAAELREVLKRLGVRAPSSARKPDLRSFVVNALRLTAMAEAGAEVKAIEAAAPVEREPESLPALPTDAGGGVLPSLTRWQQITAMADYLAKSNLTPSALRGKPHDVGSVLLRAHDLGIPLTSALENLYVIDGKVGMEGKLMMALVRRDGHSITVDDQSNAQQAIVHGKRADNGDAGSVSFTLDDAFAAGLIDGVDDQGRVKPKAGKQVWRAYTADMLKWRAVARLCRELFSDCLAGVSYTPDELGYIEPDEPGPRSGRAGEAEPTVTHRQQCEQIAQRIGALPDDLRVELRETLWKPRRFPAPQDLRPAMVTQALRWLVEYEEKAAERDDTSAFPEADVVDAEAAAEAQETPDGVTPGSGAYEAETAAEGPVEGEVVELCAGCQEEIPAGSTPIIGNDGEPYCPDCAPFALGGE